MIFTLSVFSRYIEAMNTMGGFGRKTISFAAAIACIAIVSVAGCSSDSADTPVPEASGDPMVAVDDPNEEFRMSLIGEGLTVEKAGEESERAGYSWRVGEIDGEPQAVTMDYREDRLTFTVEGGIVTDAVWG